MPDCVDRAGRSFLPSPMIIRFAMIVVIVAGAILSGATAAVAAPMQATLIYDQESITLLNSGEDSIDLSLLTFIRNDDSNSIPVRFDGRSWGINSLASGECVQLRSSGVGRLIRGTCKRLVRWITTTREDAYFWHKADNVKQFRVAYGSEEAATCEIKAGRCTFAVEGLPRFEALNLTYTVQSFYLSNDGITPIPLGRLWLCGATNSGDIALPCTHLVPSKTTLKPGDCLRIGLSVTLYESNCLSVRALQNDSVFWNTAFTVISPVTASLTLCPAAIPDDSQRCVVPG